MEETTRQISRQALEEVRGGIAMVQAGEIRTAQGLVELAKHYSITTDLMIEHLSDMTMPNRWAGLPEVSEFLKLEIAAALGMTERSAAHLLTSILILRYRHPLLWDVFRQGRIPRWQASKLTELCVELSPEAAAKVDQRIAEKAGRISFTLLKKHTAGWVAQADPELAATREETERGNRHVSFRTHHYGTSSIFGDISTTDALALENSIHQIATRMAERGDGRDSGQRRAAALGILADPAQAALWLTGEELPGPSVKRRAIVYIHLSDAALRTTHPASTTHSTPTSRHHPTDPAATVPGIARIEGIGPLTTASLPEFLRGTHVTIRPVLDLSRIPSTDRYEIPDQIREAVHVRYPIEIFPYSASDSRGLDLDHTTAWRRNGGTDQTRLENLAPLSRRVHRAKTMQAWKLTKHGSHEYHWESPLGYQYVTNADGTSTVPTHSAIPAGTAP